MGRTGFGCLAVAVVVLVVIPAGLYFTGRGHMVLGTAIALVVAGFNAGLFFQLRRITARNFADSVWANWPLCSLLGWLTLVGMLLGAVMSFMVWQSLMGWGPALPFLWDRGWLSWVAVYVLCFVGAIGEGVNMANGGADVR